MRRILPAMLVMLIAQGCVIRTETREIIRFKTLPAKERVILIVPDSPPTPRPAPNPGADIA